jgi:preprotein translocase subunit SecG
LSLSFEGAPKEDDVEGQARESLVFLRKVTAWLCSLFLKSCVLGLGHKNKKEEESSTQPTQDKEREGAMRDIFLTFEPLALRASAP